MVVKEQQMRVYLDRAVRKLKRGELGDAEEACHAALEAMPGDHRPQRILAAIDQRRGDSRRALERLEKLVKDNERDAALWRQLGILYSARSNREAAVNAFRMALTLKPRDHAVRIRLADIERERGNAEAALRYAEEVLATDPGNSDAQWIAKVLQAESPEQQAARRDNEALFNQALRAQYRGDVQRAQSLYRALLKRDAMHFPALHLLGVLLAQSGQAAEAADMLTRACSVNKTDPDAWNNLAAAQTLSGRYREAVESLRKALRLRPAFAEAFNNLGRALTLLNRFDDAARSFRRAIRLRPDYLDAHANLADLFLVQGANSDAAATYAEALALVPGHPVIETQRGTAMYRLGRVDDAMKCFENALARQPDFAPAHVNRAFLLLSQGEYNQGWSELEWRFRDPRFTDGPARRLPEEKRWRGGSVAGKRLLIYAEGSPAETLMMLRYVAALKARRASITLWCAPPWAAAFSQWGIADAIHSSPAAPSADSFDLFVPQLSMPQVMATELDSVPAPLRVSPADLSLPQRFIELAAQTGKKIGLVWDAPGRAERRFDRCCPVQAVASLLDVADARVFGFEKPPEGYGELAGIHSFHGELRGVEDLIGAVAAMDYVVGVDSTVVHLALALGKPTWVLLGIAPEWAWTRGQGQSAWYPEARLLRVSDDGDWSAVFAQIASEIGA